MSLEELRSDMELNSDDKALMRLDALTREYLKETLWPWLSNVLEQIGEMDDSIGELIEQTEDFLHAETAEELGKPLGIGLTLAAEIEKRLQPGDQALRKVVGEYRQAAAQAIATLRDISIADGDDEEGGEGAAPANGNAAPDDDEGDEGDEVSP